MRLDKRYVHCMWDDELDGKEVVVADYISEIQQWKRTEVHWSGDEDFPFRGEETGSKYAYAYDDPLLDYKLAYERGETVEYATGARPDEWYAVTDGHDWNPACKYRVTDARRRNELYLQILNESWQDDKTVQELRDMTVEELEALL